MADPLTPEYTVTVGTGWTYIGNGDALRLKSINHAAGVAVIEIAPADRAFPDQSDAPDASGPSQQEEPCSLPASTVPSPPSSPERP